MEWLLYCGGIFVIALFLYRRSAARALDDLASARIRIDVLQNQLMDAERVLAQLSNAEDPPRQSAANHVEVIRARLENVRALEVVLARRCSARVSALTARLLFLPAPDA